MKIFLLIASIIVFVFFLSHQAIAQGNQTVINGNQTTAITFPAGSCTYNWVNNTPGIGLPASGTGDITAFKAVNNGNTAITATITASPTLSGFAYIANQADGTVSVISLATNTIVSTVKAGRLPQSVAVSPDGSRAYVTSRNDNNVTVIDTKTNTVVATIPVNYYPLGIAVSPDGKFIYVVKHNQGGISVISAASNTVVADIPETSDIWDLKVSPDGGKLYVTDYSSNTVTVIDLGTNTTITKIPAGAFPLDLWFTPDGSKLYVTNTNSNNVSVISTATNMVVSTIDVGVAPKGITITPDGKTAYVANFSSNSVSVINTATNTVIKTISVGLNPYEISVSADGSRVFVVNNGSNLVSVINTATNTAIAAIPVGSQTNIPGASGNFIAGGCNGSPITFTITIKPLSATPTITASLATGTISACLGSPSASPHIQQFTVSGTGLTNNITATAPTGFEISLLAGSGYGNTVTIPESGGKASNTIIYVRSAASATGNIGGSVTLTSQGAVTQGVNVLGTVNALPTVNTVGNQTVSTGNKTTAVNFTGTANTFNWINNAPGIGLPASGVGNIPAFTAINNSSSPVIATITVTPVNVGYAYIANENSNTSLSVINTSTNTVVSSITVGSNPTGVAISPDNSRAYVTNNSSGTVSVINTLTNSVIKTIQVGQGPTGIYISPDGSRLYVANIQSNTVSVINTATNAVIATIPVDSPYGIAIGSNGKWVYVTNRSSQSVTVINPLTNSVAGTAQVGLMPGGIVTAHAGNNIFVANSNSNTITVIDGGTNSPVLTIPVGKYPSCLTVNPDGSLLYVSNAGSNTVSVISLLTATVVATIPVGSYPQGLSFTPDGILYVNNFNDGTVSVIDPANNAVIKTIPVGVGPVSMGNFIKGGSGCAGAPITFTITVNSTQPTITPGTVTGDISACTGVASASPDIEQFTVSGNNLTGNIVATAPTGFEVSLTASGGYSNSVTITQTAGKVNAVTLYVRSAASATGGITGNVVLTSSGVTPQNVAVSGIINPLINVNPVSDQAVNNGSATTAVNFTGTAKVFEWVNNTPAIGLPANGSGNLPVFTAKNNGTTPVTARVTVTPTPESFAYIANGSAGTVSVISLASNTVVATIPTGKTSLGVAINPDGKKVYITNQQSNTISVIDTKTNKVISTINEYQGAEPSGVVISPDGSKLYVSNYNSFLAISGVYIYDTATNALIGSVPIDGFPYGLAISHDGTRVYEEGGSNKITVINTTDNTIVGNIPVSDGSTSILVSLDDSKIYVSNYLNNTVAVIDAATNAVVATIPTGNASNAIALSPDGTRLYVANTWGNTITVINTTDNSVVNTFPGGVSPMSVSVSPDGQVLYVINPAKQAYVTAMNASTGQVITTIKVGLGPNSVGNFISSGFGCADKSISFNITVNPSSITPTITAGSVTGIISGCEGSSSESPNIAQFTVSGNSLTNYIVATAPPGFEVSLSATGGYANSVTISQSAGVVNNVTMYVRSAATSTGNISGVIMLTSLGATDKTVTVTGKINTLPTVSNVPNQKVLDGTLTKEVVFNSTGADTYYWVNDNPAIGIGSGTSPEVVQFTAHNTSQVPVFGTFTVTPINTTTGCSGASVTFTIEVDPILPADITATGTLSSLSTIYGTASSSTSFSVSGTSMNAGILVTPPAGFEVSTDNTNFSTTVIVGTSGTINATTVYIRLTSKTPVSGYSGNITLSSIGATGGNVPVPNSVVTPATLTITANNVQKRSSQTLTNGFMSTGFTSSGLQNNESIGNVFMTYGDGADASAKVGTYTGSVTPSSASGGSFDPKNYTITYKAGDIMVTESLAGGPISIPNAFTPNGDGINDVWNITSLIDYPSCMVSIFTRYGSMIYQSRGYTKPWDGNYNNSPLPTGTYYYIINLQNGQAPLSGWVALIR